MSDTRISLEDSCRRLKENDSTLKSLDLSGVHIGDAGCMALGFALKNNEFLTELNLANTGIGPDGASKLAAIFRTNYTLERLYMMGNSISDKGAESLASALKVNPSLRLLNLARNSIGDIGCAALAEALVENAALYKLYLYENIVGNHGAAALAETITQNRTLQELFLWENKIGSDGLDELERAFNLVQKARTSCIQLKTQWKTDNKVNQPVKPKIRSSDDDIVARMKARANEPETPRVAIKGNDSCVMMPVPVQKSKLDVPSSRATSTIPQSSDSFAKLKAKAQSLEVHTQSKPPKKTDPNGESASAVQHAKGQSGAQGNKAKTTQRQSTVPLASASKPVACASAAASVSTQPTIKAIEHNSRLSDGENDHLDAVTNAFDFVGLRAKAKALEMQASAKATKTSRFDIDEARSQANCKKVNPKFLAVSPKTSLINVNKNELRSKVLAMEEHVAHTKRPTESSNVNINELRAKAQSVKEGFTERTIPKQSSININFQELREKAQTRERGQAIVLPQVSPRLANTLPTPTSPSAAGVRPDKAVDTPANLCPGDRVPEEGPFSFSQLMAKASALEARAKPMVKKSFI